MTATHTNPPGPPSPGPPASSPPPSRPDPWREGSPPRPAGGLGRPARLRQISALLAAGMALLAPRRAEKAGVPALAVSSRTATATAPPGASAARLEPHPAPSAVAGDADAGWRDAGATDAPSLPLPSQGKRAGELGLPALEARDIRKSLPLGKTRIEILKGISLRVARGEFVAIVGPSGSGKSTLLGIIAGLDTPTSGQVLVDGAEITHLSEGQLAAVRNRKIGMVYQAFNLIPNLTARENVEIPLYAGKHPGSPASRAQELLELVGLGHRLRNRPNQLSGGEQQRVAVARALATDPAIVIMDEPTGNLDQKSSENVLRMIHDLRQRTGTTFIIATHDPNVAAAADRAIRIVDGRIAEE